MPDWLRAYATMFWWLGALSVATFVGSLLAIPVLVARIPADYFSRDHPKPALGHDGHLVLRLFGRILKNLLGMVFILAGLAMLLLPGQGIITILIGVTLLDFPGRRTLERRIVQQPAILSSINWIRAKAQQPPLDLTIPDASPTEH
jgi:hypothetical protein